MLDIQYIHSKSYGASEPDTVSVHVNGQQTNIWYRLPNYPYYEANNDGGKTEALKAVKWIEEGLIHPSNGDWTGFDTCHIFNEIPQNIKIVDKIEYSNKILSCQSFAGKYTGEPRPEVIEELKGKPTLSQFCKRIIGDQLSDKIGIAFYSWGYDLGYIPN